MGDVLFSLREGDRSEVDCLSDLVPVLRDTIMNPLLRSVMERGCHLVSKRPSGREERNFLAESLASVHHASTKERTGKAGQMVVSSSLDRVSSLHPLLRTKIASFFSDKILSLSPETRGAWFKMRCTIMDANVVCEVISSLPHSRRTIFFGGMSHAISVSDCLSSLGVQRNACKGGGERNALREAFSDTPLPDVAVSLPFFALHSIEGERGTHVVLLLGERHDQTPMSAAEDILSFLRSACETSPPQETRGRRKNPHPLWERSFSFLVERSVPSSATSGSSGSTPLDIPSWLACDATDTLPIHKLRCDPVMESDCDKVRVRFVDNRHADMGLLREEWISLLWKRDFVFRERAIAFQRKAREDCLSLLVG